MTARFAVDATEIERPGLSYTVDTLKELTKRQPGAELFLLLGADQFRELGDLEGSNATIGRARWRRCWCRGGRAKPMRRAPRPPTQCPEPASRSCDTVRLDVSSTEIRRRRAAGEPGSDTSCPIPFFA